MKMQLLHSSAALAALKSTLRSTTCNIKGGINYNVDSSENKMTSNKKNTIYD
jgi:hypothetical protein